MGGFHGCLYNSIAQVLRCFARASFPYERMSLPRIASRLCFVEKYPRPVRAFLAGLPYPCHIGIGNPACTRCDIAQREIETRRLDMLPRQCTLCTRHDIHHPIENARLSRRRLLKFIIWVASRRQMIVDGCAPIPRSMMLGSLVAFSGDKQIAARFVANDLRD